MRAVVITKHGDLSVLQVQERPDPPPPTADQVRIAVRAAGVNFADHLARVGLYPDAPKPPSVVGYEVAGTIDAVGDGVDPARVGERVFAGTRFGGYAEIVNVQAAGRCGPTSGLADVRAGCGDPGELRHRLGGFAWLRVAARR
jgi:NADPH:quinone reductase-like Zn-dependent oxidoreductase